MSQQHASAVMHPGNTSRHGNGTAWAEIREDAFEVAQQPDPILAGGSHMQQDATPEAAAGAADGIWDLLQPPEAARHESEAAALHAWNSKSERFTQLASSHLLVQPIPICLNDSK